jgi:hypothetical protein
MTVYLNIKYNGSVETVDEFTLGENVPSNPREFRDYTNAMLREYHTAGMSVYKSKRCTKDWRNN